MDLQPECSFKRASVLLDLAFVSGLLRDKDLCTLYAREAEEEARGAVEARAAAAWSAHYSRRNDIIDLTLTELLVPDAAGYLQRRRLQGITATLSDLIVQYTEIKAAAQAFGAEPRDALPNVLAGPDQRWSSRTRARIQERVWRSLQRLGRDE